LKHEKNDLLKLFGFLLLGGDVPAHDALHDVTVPLLGDLAFLGPML
jgi:hypothetical protein